MKKRNEQGRKGYWMLTSQGNAYWPHDPRPEEVLIEDIAAALSKICRYTGHTVKFYSVAEHSLLVSYLVPPHLALEGLLHDAAEAYCADLNRPIKIDLPEYKKIEEKNDHAIRTKFGLPLEESPEVKTADNDMLILEQEQVMPVPKHGMDWSWGGKRPEGVRIYGFAPILAEHYFMNRFEQLYRGTRAL